jgi:predicted transcriptional regulator
MTRDAALSIRIPSALKAELQRRADADQRSLASLATIALQFYVDKASPKSGSKTSSKS